MSSREIQLTLYPAAPAPPLPPPPSGVGILEVHVTRLFRWRHHSADGRVTVTEGGNSPSHELWGQCLLPRTVLPRPALLRRLLFNFLRSFDLDGDFLEFAAQRILERVAMEMAAGTTRGGWGLVAFLELNTVADIDAEAEITELLSEVQRAIDAAFDDPSPSEGPSANNLIQSVKREIYRRAKVIEKGKEKKGEAEAEREGKGTEEEEGVVCAVCLDEIEDGAECSRLGCSHLFHYDCILPWLQRQHDSCPMCRCTIH
ncbi:uncharacterized protein LOC131156179 [Malania oleifera]|uniref:uncharacterized protein LOC131156179 n=1 Tax=Malania oleifera TaxID=397392 RepID=UPI0025ADC192|nr:uncharacterized protein LOC131156179 [Malania oleifera]